MSTGKKFPAVDHLDHFFDPRNAKCNPKIANGSSTSTVYTDVFRNKIPFNVSYHNMLHADGYLDFPIPLIGGNGSTGEQGSKYNARFGDTVNTYNTGNQQLIEVDTTTNDGYCWMQWINVNKIPPINTATVHPTDATATTRRTMQVFVEDKFGSNPYVDTTYDNDQFYLQWLHTNDTNRSTDADFAYNIHLRNRSVTVAASSSAQGMYFSNNKIERDTWVCIVVQGSLLSSTTGNVHPSDPSNYFLDVWVDDSKVVDDTARTFYGDSNHEPDVSSVPGIWRLKWLGSDQNIGYHNHSPALSFVGSMGPSVFWNKRLTDTEYLEAYNYFLNKLPT